jgi:hypothetical protein
MAAPRLYASRRDLTDLWAKVRKRWTWQERHDSVLHFL